jgi:hypothetical protein
MREKRAMDVTVEDLKSVFNNMEKIEELLFKEPAVYMKIGSPGSDLGNMHTMDLFCNAVINRALALSKGFRTLAETNNYISAVPLIRIQIDNCLRFFASMIVADYNSFFMKYLEGEHIGNLTDASGERMTDTYLAKKMNKELFPGIYNMYKNTSSYIHLSNEHSFLHNKIVENDGSEMRMQTIIGKDVDHFSIDKKVDFAFNMFKATEFLYKLVRTWKYQKIKVENELNNNMGGKTNN